MFALALVAWLLYRAEIAAAAQRAELARVNHRITAISAGQTRFADRMAHDLRAQLAVIVNWVALVQKCATKPKEVLAHTKSLADHLLHLAELCDAYLHLGGQSGTPDRRDHAPIAFPDVVMEAVRRSRSLANERMVAVAVTIREPENDLPLELLGSELLLVAMTECLLRHALRRSTPGSSVSLHLELVMGSLLLRVTDHGPTIPSSGLATAFTWFSAAEGSASAAATAGGGLQFAKRVAEHHHGTIVLSSQPPNGSVCDLRLPCSRGFDATMRPTTATPPGSGAEHSTGGPAGPRNHS